MPALRDITGQRFGRLLVAHRVGYVNGRVAWMCRCDCGAEAIRSSNTLLVGKVRSCGCLRSENARRCGALSDGTANITHGMSHRSEYKIWKSMRRRGSGKGTATDRELYRDVTCCDRWASFGTFIADMGPRPSHSHSIDRIDNAKGYSPDNCRWATSIQQANNRRKRRTTAEVVAARAALQEA